MKCPTCLQRFGPESGSGLERCPRCGASMAMYDTQFGMTPSHLPFVNDLSVRLTVSEENSLRRTLERFSIRFPQARFHFFLLDLLPGTDVREYGFWLMNRCRLDPVGCRLNKNYSILLLVDPVSKTASISAGYGCEAFVTDEDWAAILEKAAPAFARGHWAKGARICLDETMRFFNRGAKLAERGRAAA